MKTCNLNFLIKNSKIPTLLSIRMNLSNQPQKLIMQECLLGTTTMPRNQICLIKNLPNLVVLISIKQSIPHKINNLLNLCMIKLTFLARFWKVKNLLIKWDFLLIIKSFITKISKAKSVQIILIILDQKHLSTNNQQIQLIQKIISI